MIIDIKMLEERLNTLENQKIQLLANVNACDGAIQDCKHWLSVLEHSDTSS